MACAYPGVRVTVNLPDGRQSPFPGAPTVLVKDHAFVRFGDAQFFRDSGLPCVDIPCGKCASCRLKARREMTYRLSLEAESYSPDEVFFITLTYDPAHIHPGERVFLDPDTGSLECFTTWSDGSRVGTLWPDDFVRFFKRLRDHLSRKYDVQVREYHCGEYGSNTLRPHYHLILFGAKEWMFAPTWYVVKDFSKGFRTSPFLESLWGHGFVSYSQCTFDMMQYVAGYCLKKKFSVEQENDAELWYLAHDYIILDPDEYFHLSSPCYPIAPYEIKHGAPRLVYPQGLVLPEKASGSNRPGIGRTYFERNVDRIYGPDELIIRRPGKAPIHVQPVSYFDRLYDIDYPDDLALIKDRRRARAVELMDVRSAETGLSAQALTCQDVQRDLSLFRRIKRNGLFDTR